MRERERKAEGGRERQRARHTALRARASRQPPPLLPSSCLLRHSASRERLTSQRTTVAMMSHIRTHAYTNAHTHTTHARAHTRSACDRARGNTRRTRASSFVEEGGRGNASRFSSRAARGKGQEEQRRLTSSSSNSSSTTERNRTTAPRIRSVRRTSGARTGDFTTHFAFARARARDTSLLLLSLASFPPRSAPFPSGSHALLLLEQTARHGAAGHRWLWHHKGEATTARTYTRAPLPLPLHAPRTRTHTRTGAAIRREGWEGGREKDSAPRFLGSRNGREDAQIRR